MGTEIQSNFGAVGEGVGQDSTWDLQTLSSPAEGILVASVHLSGYSVFMEQLLSFKRSNK